jgi:hypothetical protein
MQRHLGLSILAIRTGHNAREIVFDFSPTSAPGDCGDISIGPDKPDAIVCERRADGRLKHVAVASE